MKCPKCQTENPDTLKFCGECGAQLGPAEEFSLFQTETLESSLKELATGSTFAGRYQIIEELGKGGMGRVYKVLDTHINEKVALKLLKPEIAADKKTIERFSNELKFARKISHRNVCRMYDLGKAEETSFITMEYVQGEDLKSMLQMMGQLSAGQIVSIGKQVCDGLAEAHRLGVIHRDLKPQNIMIDKGGNAKIMDFGIARSIKEKGITGPSVLIGTPEYMSPEQAEAKEVDQRSDIYSLGIILYEMGTGRVPFEGDTALSIAMKHKGEIPKNPKQHNPNIPDDLSGIILKCLEKDRSKRYQTAAELRSEFDRVEKGIPAADLVVPKPKSVTSKEITLNLNLKKLLVPAVVLVALVLSGLVISKVILNRASPKKAKSVAVLPFVNMSGDKDDEYFSDGMTEELINALSKLKGLHVAARTSSFMFKGKTEDISRIGQQLHVDTILEGSCRKAGKKLRVSAQLIDVTNGFNLWSESYEREIQDVFAIQDEITSAVVGKLKVALLGEDKAKLTRQREIDPAAYEAYLKGIYLWWQYSESEEVSNNALLHFRRAIEIEPDYAPPYAGIALTYITASSWLYLWPAREAMPKAKEAAERAIQLDSAFSDGYVARGMARMLFDWDWSGAENDFKRAVELSPNSTLALDQYGSFFVLKGRFEESHAVIKRALELDPLSPTIHNDLGWAYWLAGQFDRAIPYLRGALELDQNFHSSRRMLGLSYLSIGKETEALAELKTAVRLAPDWPLNQTTLGYGYGVTGHRAEALEALANLEQLIKTRYVPPTARVIIYLGLGQKEVALNWLEKACDERDGWITGLIVEPELAPWRNEPRFQALLKKMGLAK